MKKQLLFFILVIYLSQNTFAQYFEKLIEGEIVNTLSDSRSCNWIDINQDGWLDAQITNGKSPGENNLLYINNGNGTFTTVTDGAIVSDNTPSDGATWADYDNDGDLDCFVVNWYNINNLFYENNGDGTFTQITEGDFVNDMGYSETASWGDFNKDGFVDLYVTNSAGAKKNFLYKNNGNGTFEKIISGDMVNDNKSSRSVNWVDYDMDGDLDLFVTNESSQNENLYRNNGDETFTSIIDNALVTAGGSTMSSSWGDIDNDGDQDVFLANNGVNNGLFRNDGDGVFTALSSDIVSNTGGNSFGSNFADIDNDGDLDLFVSNAFGAGELNNFLFINDGTGAFTQITTDITTTDMGWSFGNAFGDYDQDGDMDLLVANCYGGSQNNCLYKNETSGNNWIVINCMGTISNRSAIGAVVKIKATIQGESIWQMREIFAQTGYCGQNMLPVHFGLGDAVTIDTIIILWPSGIIDTFISINKGEYINVVEGETGSDITVGKGSTYQFSIYPNPVLSEISVQYTLQNNEQVIIQIFDQSGKLFMKDTVGEKNIGINTSSYDLTKLKIVSGNYIMVMKTNSGFATQKFIYTK